MPGEWHRTGRPEISGPGPALRLMEVFTGSMSLFGTEGTPRQMPTTAQWARTISSSMLCPRTEWWWLEEDRRFQTDRIVFWPARRAIEMVCPLPPSHFFRNYTFLYPFTSSLYPWLREDLIEGICKPFAYFRR